MSCCGVTAGKASAVEPTAADWVAGAACRTPLVITPPVVIARAAATLVRLHLGRRAGRIGFVSLFVPARRRSSFPKTRMRDANEENVGRS